MKILVVDDDDNSRIFLERALRARQYAVESAVDGVDALKKASQWLPDLIVSDIMMPNMNGFELCRKVKTDEQLRTIPFVFYTATFVDQNDEKLAMELGASRFLIKPMEQDDFFKIIQAVIEEHQTQTLAVPDRPLTEMKELCLMQADALQRKLEKKVKELEAEREALRQSEARFRALIEDAPDAVYMLDANGKLILANKKAGQDLGYSPEELQAMTVMEIDESVPHLAVLQDLWEKIEPGICIILEGRHRRKDGSLFPVETRLCQVADEGQKKVLAFARDISLRKQNETVLRRLNHQLQESIEAMPIGYILWDQEFRVIEWNRSAERIFGFQKGDIIGEKAIESIVPKEMIPLVAAMAERLLRGEPATYSEKNANIRSDGSKISCKWHHIPLKDETGQVFAILSMVEDITAQLRQDEARRRLETAIEQATECFVITDRYGKIQYVNPSFEHLTGYSAEEVLGKNPRILQSGKLNQAFYAKMWHTITHGKVWKGHFINKKKDGSIFEEEATITPVLDDNGGITNFIAVKRDVTNQLQLEKQLHQAQKMEAIGTLAGGIAHDFNNILAAILGYAELATMDVRAPEKLDTDLSEITNAANRAKDLVKQILTFSRKTEQEMRPLRVSLVVNEAMKLLRKTIPSTIEIKHDIASTATALADPTQIHQIIMNLCTNAYHAMRESGGTLSVSLHEREFTEKEMIPDQEIIPGRYLQLEVADTGQGMDEETQRKIFEPYFTTKEVGEGTGLGLAVVHGIVQSHGGHVTVRSEVGKGTTFYVYLPVSAEEHGASRSKEHKVPPQKGTEKIMFVDDEAMLVGIANEIFPKYGYVVETFSNGIQALQEFEKEPERYDLIVTDMTMPYMNGLEFIKRIHAIRPGLPVILCSGYNDLISKEKAETIGLAYIQKPIIMSDLINLVRKVFDNAKS